MKKMLILNGSHSEIPLIIEAKKMGYYVITSGNDPSLIGHDYADEYICEDYSDKEAMLSIAKKANIDGVVSCANDFGIITAAYIGEQMRLRGHDSFAITKILHQKDSFKRFAIENKLMVPFSVVCTSVEEGLESELDFPVIVKPVDLTGGKGVSKVDAGSGLKSALENAFLLSREKRAVIEKFIVGSYHSFSTFIINKKVIAYFSDNEYSFINPYFVASSGGPATEVGTVKDQLIKQTEIIAEKLDLVNGVFHIQYVMDGNGTPYIMDITRRCSGDIYPEPVEHATGLPWAKWIVMAEVGCDSTGFHVEDYEFGRQKKFCGRHCIMAERNGMIQDIQISDELEENIYKKIIWKKQGERIDNYLVDKCGILFWEFSSRDEMLSKISRARELVRVIM